MKYNFDKLFYQMLRIRLVEEKLIELYPSDVIQSPVHLSLGQEHHAVCLAACLEKKDQLFTTYRNHALYLAKGGSLKLMFAELFGKQSGVCKGKAGSMHLCSVDIGMMGSSAIVASTYSHSLGAAYALKHLRSRNIAVSVTGDGSTEEGTFHETLNFASLKKLPVLFVIENNGLSINTPIQERQAFKLPALTRAYGIKYDIIRSGAEIGTSYDKLLKAVHYVRNTSRPLLVEVITCRYKQHVGISDDIDKGFRDLEEYDKWKCGDPLIKHPDLTAKFEKRIRREIKSAVAFARQSPFPSMEELLKDVY